MAGDGAGAAADMSNTESMRDAGTCLGGFLGMFLGAMLGFALFMQFLFGRVARNDGTIPENLALLPFLGVMAAGCVGAVGGALLARLACTACAKVCSSTSKNGPGR